jgi:hypothetical protein
MGRSMDAFGSKLERVTYLKSATGEEYYGPVESTTSTN